MKFLKHKNKIFILLILGFIVSAGGVSAATAPFPNYVLEVPIGSTTSVRDIADYINTIYTFGVGIIGIVATVMIMFGGMKWLLAAGSQSKIGEAKEIMTSAIVGLVLALTSFLILNTINPALVTMSSTAVEIIEVVPYVEEGSTAEAGGSCEEDADCTDKCSVGGVQQACKCLRFWKDTPDEEKRCFPPSVNDIVNGQLCYVDANCIDEEGSTCDKHHICRAPLGGSCSAPYECINQNCVGDDGKKICTSGIEDDKGVCKNSKGKNKQYYCRSDFWCCESNHVTKGLCTKADYCKKDVSTGYPCEYGPDEMCSSGNCSDVLGITDTCD